MESIKYQAFNELSWNLSHM